LRLLTVLACLIAGLATAAAASPARTSRSWAQPQIRVVVGHGLLARSVGSFRPNDPLTQGELSDLVAALTQEPPRQVGDPSAPVTMAQLDARLVRVLDLSDDAALLYDAAAGAGLRPPARFGTEVVARRLGLRTNHPAGQDNLERLPNDPAPRAEAAYSVARLLSVSESEKAQLEDEAAAFELPVLTTWQQRVLTTAVKFIGYPYIWGGEFETPQSPFGAQIQGGFDCSGFVWRVFKLQPFDGAPSLADVLKGRTTYAMSGEVSRAQRIAPDALQPADVLFFGTRGAQSKPTEIGHSGIYVGNGWFVHSSSGGVTLQPLQGWYADELAWGRRPLAEAGLTA